MTIVHPLDPGTIRLAYGSHQPNTDQEWCVMEAAAWMAGEGWSERPECASKVIGRFLISWNDAMNDDDRQSLTRYLAPAPDGVIGTADTDEVESMRAWMAADWLVRVYAPAWLRLAGLGDHADRLGALPELVDTGSALSAKPVLAAAGAAAGAAAWGAAWDAAVAAARDAARAAAWDAAWDAAGDAAVAAARDAARAAAWDAAGAAAWDAAWDAAGDAARARLAPTVTELQSSAHDLIARMIAVHA